MQPSGKKNNEDNIRKDMKEITIKLADKDKTNMKKHDQKISACVND